MVFFDFLDSHVSGLYSFPMPCAFGVIVRASRTVVIEVGSPSIERATVLAIRCNFCVGVLIAKETGASAIGEP